MFLFVTQTQRSAHLWLEPPRPLRGRQTSAPRHLWLLSATAHSQSQGWWSTSDLALVNCAAHQPQQVYRVGDLWLMMKRSMLVWKITLGFFFEKNKQLDNKEWHSSASLDCAATPTRLCLSLALEASAVSCYTNWWLKTNKKWPCPLALPWLEYSR